MTSPLQDAAERHLAFLQERGFQCVSAAAERVRYESEAVSVTLTAYRAEFGQVDLRVARLGHESPVDVRTFAGTVGTALLSRVVEILAERLRSDGQALSGDPTYFDQLAAEQQRRADEWMAYYARKGPHPQTGHLPP